MNIVINCKCTRDCDQKVSLTISENAEVSMLRVHGSMGSASAQLSRQDLVDIHIATGKALETVSNEIKKRFGGAHVQLKLPGAM